MSFCVLGSGSSGNCIYVSSNTTALLIDAGLSGRETLKRLEIVGLDPSLVKAILLTHEHGDHISGLTALRRRLNADVYANAATAQGVDKNLENPGIPWKVFSTGFAFRVGDIDVEPFTVCHDGLDPVGFALTADGIRIGIVTDIGVATAVVRERLKNCRAIVIEANHDEQMLRDAARPWALKQRIAGRQGHLANKHAAELLVECAGPQLASVYLAHLSADCNKPDLALRTVQEALRKNSYGDVAVTLTYPDKPSAVWGA